jgi:peptide chain release factor 2
MSEPGFWDNQERAQDVVQQVKQLRTWIDPFDALAARVQGARELSELLDADPDADMAAELTSELDAIEAELDAFELKSLLQGPTTRATRRSRSARARAAPRRRTGRRC